MIIQYYKPINSIRLQFSIFDGNFSDNNAQFSKFLYLRFIIFIIIKMSEESHEVAYYYHFELMDVVVCVACMQLIKLLYYFLSKAWLVVNCFLNMKSIFIFKKVKFHCLQKNKWLILKSFKVQKYVNIWFLSIFLYLLTVLSLT